MQRVLTIVKKTLGDGHDWTAISLDVLASVNERLGDWSNAQQLRREATEIMIGRTRRHEVRVDAGLGERATAPLLYLHHAHTAMHLAEQYSRQTQALTAKAFEIVQPSSRKRLRLLRKPQRASPRAKMSLRPWHANCRT